MGARASFGYSGTSFFFCCETRKIAPAETARAGGRNLATKRHHCAQRPPGGGQEGQPRRSPYSGVVRSLKQSECARAVVCKVAGMQRGTSGVFLRSYLREVFREQARTSALAPFALIDGETAAPSAFFVTGGVTLPRRCDGIALLSPSPWPSKGRPEYFPFHPAFINANHL